MRIAANENTRITPVEAGRIIKLSKNNLRKALSDLEVLGAERRVNACFCVDCLATNFSRGEFGTCFYGSFTESPFFSCSGETVSRSPAEH